MQSKKLPKRLFKNRDVVHTYEHDRATRGAIKHVTRDHLDVLQNIEFTLVALARKDPAIDDAVIDRALHNCLAGAKLPEDADSSLVRLCDRLRAMRSLRKDVSDQVWTACLKKIQKSVRLHSNLAPGATDYLEFVGPYVS